MKAKSGSAVSAVEPTEPVATFEADDAKPGNVAKVKAQQIETKTGKYGATKAPAFKPKDAEAAETKEKESEEDKTSWIEIELVGEDDKPIPSEKYEIELPDGSVASGTLDGKGFARVEGFEAGDCKVSFPKLDKAAWEKL